jgi:hypothetical protein
VAHFFCVDFLWGERESVRRCSKGFGTHPVPYQLTVHLAAFVADYSFKFTVRGIVVILEISLHHLRKRRFHLSPLLSRGTVGSGRLWHGISRALNKFCCPLPAFHIRWLVDLFPDFPPCRHSTLINLPAFRSTCFCGKLFGTYYVAG